MEESKFITQYAPYLIPFLGSLMLIVFTKRYLFQGVISLDMHTAQIERERELIRGTEKISAKLQDIVDQLNVLAQKMEAITKKVSEEIGQNNDRLTSLERAMSDYLDAFRELTKQFERCRQT